MLALDFYHIKSDLTTLPKSKNIQSTFFVPDQEVHKNMEDVIWEQHIEG